MQANILKAGTDVDKQRGLIFTTCIIFMLLLFLKKNFLSDFFPGWPTEQDILRQKAWIEHDQEEAAYQNAVCWTDGTGRC